MSEPIDMTLACINNRNRYASRSSQMPIYINWKQKTNDTRKWAFTIAIVKHNGVCELIEKIVENRTKHRLIDDTRLSIIDRLSHIEREVADVEMDTLRVSIKCPVGYE